MPDRRPHPRPDSRSRGKVQNDLGLRLLEYASHCVRVTDVGLDELKRAPIAECVQDALREFTVGAALDSGRADTFAFEGVAYDQLLRGDFLMAKRTRDGNERAITAYHTAVRLDPRSARALASLGVSIERVHSIPPPR